MLGISSLQRVPEEKYRKKKEVEMDNEKIVAVLDSMVAEAASWGLYQVLKRKEFPVRSTNGVRNVIWTPTSHPDQALFRVPVLVGREDDVSDRILYVDGVVDPKGIIIGHAYDAEGNDIYFAPIKPRL